MGKPLLYPNDPNIVAIASDTRPPNAPLPFADLDDIEAIADLVDKLARPFPHEHCQCRLRRSGLVLAGGRSVRFGGEKAVA